MLALIKTQVGCFLGKVERTNTTAWHGYDLHILHYPCLIDFIPVPVPGRIQGQVNIGVMRSIISWPDMILNVLCELGAYSLIAEDDPEKNSFVDLYNKTIAEQWPHLKIKGAN